MPRGRASSSRASNRRVLRHAAENRARVLTDHDVRGLCDFSRSLSLAIAEHDVRRITDCQTIHRSSRSRLHSTAVRARAKAPSVRPHGTVRVPGPVRVRFSRRQPTGQHRLAPRTPYSRAVPAHNGSSTHWLILRRCRFTNEEVPTVELQSLPVRLKTRRQLDLLSSKLQKQADERRRMFFALNNRRNLLRAGHHRTSAAPDQMPGHGVRSGRSRSEDPPVGAHRHSTE